MIAQSFHDGFASYARWERGDFGVDCSFGHCDDRGEEMEEEEEEEEEEVKSVCLW